MRSFSKFLALYWLIIFWLWISAGGALAQEFDAEEEPPPPEAAPAGETPPPAAPRSQTYRQSINGQHQDLQLWVTNNIQLHYKRVGVQCTVSPRVGGNITRMVQFRLSGQVGYQLLRHWNVWQGYAWIPSYIPGFVDQHRTYQQIDYDHLFGRLVLVNRLRMEERFISHFPRTQYRLRDQVRFQYPLTYHWAIVGWTEPFLNLNKVNVIQRGPRELRTFLGLQYKFNNHSAVEVGYQNQLINRDRPTQYRDNHILMVNTYLTF